MCAILCNRSLVHAWLVTLLSFPISIALAQKPLIEVSKIEAAKAVGDKFFFAADDGVHGMELWISNGTEEGTRMVKDINDKSLSGSSPANFAVYNGELFFSAYKDEYQIELWKSDGTEAGTQLVVDLVPGGDYYGGSNPTSLTVFKGLLYFNTTQGVYRTDGTASGTILIQSISSQDIVPLTILGDYLYLYADGTLYRTNGTAVAEIPLPHKEVDEDVYFRKLYATKDKLIAFSWGSNYSSFRFHVLNTSATDWTLLKEYNPGTYGYQEIDHFIVIDDKLFYTRRNIADNEPATDDLWVTNGTDTGTTLLKTFPWNRYAGETEALNHFAYNGALYFRGPEKLQRGFWRSDGTSAGTQQISNVTMTNPYYDISVPAIVNGKAFFCGNGDIWSTDGTTTGTVREFKGGDVMGYSPFLFTAVGDLLYYVIGKQFGATLWNTSPAPEIDVTVNNAPIANGGILQFQSVLTDDCNKATITISNTGRRELMLSGVHLTGNDFFLNGSVPELIAPGAKITLDAFFYPLSPGAKETDLYISTNDGNEADYKITLKGTTLSSSAHGFCQSFNSKSATFLIPENTSRTIKLSNTIITEGRPAGTMVATISAPTWDAATYSLVDGVGSEDNRHFMVVGNVLSTNRPFQFSSKKMYTLRLKAIHGADSREEFFVINVLAQPPSITNEICAPDFRRYDRGFMGIAMNSVGDLFTVDTDGDIARSSDDATSWRKVGDGVKGFQPSFFFKNTKGYYFNYYGILKSDDDGANWFQVLFPGNAQVASFIDEDFGYVSASNGDLFYTENGGRTWNSRGVSGDAFRALHFWTKEKGIGIRSYYDLVMTNDGGKTWQKIAFSEQGWAPRLTAIYFVNQSIGFLCSENYLHRTTDGGKTWTMVPDVSLSAYPPAIKFTDENNGFLFSGGLFRTTDGGKSWDMTTAPGPSAVTGVAWSASKHTLYTSNGDGAGYYYGRAVNKSTDNGETWQESFSSPLTQINDIEFPTEDVGYLFGPYSNYKTTDQGMTWKPLSWTTPAVNAVFFDENTGVVTDNFNIYKTVDGGETVQKIYELPQVPEESHSMGQLYAVSPSLIFTYGWQSIYRSTDGGYHWQVVSTDDKGTQELSFVSSTIGYRLVTGGTVQKTTNGGANWSDVYSTPDGSFIPASCLLFVDEQVGFRGGNNLEKTTDGGVSWKRITDDLPDYISRVQFTDLSHGYALTGNGIFETSDGGATWRRLPINDIPGAYRFKYRNNSIYMCGDNGFVARLIEGTVTPSQPGYISGPDEVCMETSQTYALPVINNANRSLYDWSVSGEAVLKYDGTTATVEFPKAGTYTLTVKAVNACGISESRTLDIETIALAEPAISGKTTVAPKEIGVRYDLVGADPALSYQWYATGGTATSTDDALFTMVNWNESASESKVSAIAIDRTHGCRASGSLSVMVDQTIVGIEDEWNADIAAFPNPVENELRIRSFMNFPLMISIYDARGREFQSSELSAFGETTLDVRKLPAGLYVLKMEGNSKDKSYSRKIIKR